MKRHYSIKTINLLILLFIGFYVNGQIKNTWLNVKGNVKSIIGIDYESKDTATHSEGYKVNSAELYLFNSFGQHVLSREIKPDSSVTSKFFFVFDDNGKQTGSRYYDINGQFNGKTIYSYNSRGDQVETLIYSKDGKVTTTKYDYKYYKDGFEKVTYVPNDTGFKSISRYDNMGYLIETITKSGNKSERTVYKNDSAGNNIEMTIYNTDGTLNMTSINKFDHQGNKTEDLSILYFNGRGEKVFSTTSFEYDSKGNWMRRVNRSGSLVWICENIIEYYPVGYKVTGTSYNDNVDSVIKEINSFQDSVFRRKELLLEINYNELTSVYSKVSFKEYCDSVYLKDREALSKKKVRKILFSGLDSIYLSDFVTGEYPSAKVSVKDHIEKIGVYPKDTILRTPEYTAIVYEFIRDNGAEKFLYTFDKKGKVISRFCVSCFMSSSLYIKENKTRATCTYMNVQLLKDHTIIVNSTWAPYKFVIEKSGRIAQMPTGGFLGK